MDVNYDLLLIEIKVLHKKYNDYSNKKKYIGLTQDEFVKEMETAHPNIKDKFASIFIQCVNGQMDLNVITYMINQAKEVKKNKVSNHDASVKVGQKLVDTFIKPNMDKDKKK
jgi:hypothetical protein